MAQSNGIREQVNQNEMYGYNQFSILAGTISYITGIVRNLPIFTFIKFLHFNEWNNKQNLFYRQESDERR